jgi:hypothetical protein
VLTRRALPERLGLASKNSENVRTAPLDSLHRQLKDRRLNPAQRQKWHEAQYGTGPRDALTTPAEQWERRSGQDRRGHPFYRSQRCSKCEKSARQDDDTAPISDG